MDAANASIVFFIIPYFIPVIPCYADGRPACVLTSRLSEITMVILQ
jgi:hypothetical protein